MNKSLILTVIFISIAFIINSAGASALACTNNAECLSYAPVCSAGICVECMSNSDCTAKYSFPASICTNGVCAQCSSSSDCTLDSSPICIDGFCSPCDSLETSSQWDSACKERSGSSANCDRLGTGRCLSLCTLDPQCTSNSKPSCKNGICVKCAENSVCIAKLGANGVCVDGSCAEAMLLPIETLPLGPDVIPFEPMTPAPDDMIPFEPIDTLPLDTDVIPFEPLVPVPYDTMPFIVPSTSTFLPFDPAASLYPADIKGSLVGALTGYVYVSSGLGIILYTDGSYSLAGLIPYGKDILICSLASDFSVKSCATVMTASRLSSASPGDVVYTKIIDATAKASEESYFRALSNEERKQKVIALSAKLKSWNGVPALNVATLPEGLI